MMSDSDAIFAIFKSIFDFLTDIEILGLPLVAWLVISLVFGMIAVFIGGKRKK